MQHLYCIFKGSIFKLRNNQMSALRFPWVLQPRTCISFRWTSQCTRLVQPFIIPTHHFHRILFDITIIVLEKQMYNRPVLTHVAAVNHVWIVYADLYCVCVCVCLYADVSLMHLQNIFYCNCRRSPGQSSLISVRV